MIEQPRSALRPAAGALKQASALSTRCRSSALSCQSGSVAMSTIVRSVRIVRDERRELRSAVDEAARAAR